MARDRLFLNHFTERSEGNEDSNLGLIWKPVETKRRHAERHGGFFAAAEIVDLGPRSM